MDNQATKIYSLGRKIFKVRRERGYTQDRLAEILDISREHPAKIETAKRTVSLDLLINIADALNIQVRDLIDF